MPTSVCAVPPSMTGPLPAGKPSRPARVAGWAGLVLIGLAVSVMLAIALLGPSAAVPNVGGPPPWSWRAGPSDTLAVQLGWVAMITGGLGVGVALHALRRGWRPARGVLLAGVLLAVPAMALVPPAGSTDVLNYAVYGRIAALGHDPYITTPSWLFKIGDPVGVFAPQAWRHTPSVYGPLATWAQMAASRLGGDSMAGTVLAFKIITAVAFLLSALMLDRLAGPDRGRRARVHLLWSLNPLMLWHVVLGGHIDGLGAFFLIAAFLALRGGGLAGGFGSGVLLAAAATVKAPFILAGAGLMWAARKRFTALAAMLMGLGAALVAAYATQGPEALDNVAGKIGSRSLADPWRLITDAMGLGVQSSVLEGRLALGAALVIGLLLCWGLPEGPEGLGSVRPALAWCLCWLLTSPVQHPWYDAMLFPMLALMPAGRLDGLLVARGVVTSLIYLPGGAAILSPTAFTQWISETYRPLVAPLAADLIILCLVVLSVARALRHRRPVPRPAAKVAEDTGEPD
ncbi:polyprenol phosphomannose-dependent alpha 1,6 mannosyltransferase MptB [Sphaerisporangium fuscum]|uniref:polyprenol phosphomannose-dependent alpha 1,6 mannosyltransferase MptB n=1 Tax=Sphaerisporangium fuscum TaxID=2835868 RepID=UPI001BDC3CF8|nr:polyprenol phosphomannose-dependent alpha 1,6 mannosyltransferase MptB [Sphaerisporangium fuscum]